MPSTQLGVESFAYMMDSALMFFANNLENLFNCSKSIILQNLLFSLIQSYVYSYI